MWNTLLPALLAAPLILHAADYKIEQREPIHHVFTGDRALDVDQVNGSISVVGDSATTMRVEGERIIRAADQQEAERAKREVTLDINEKAGVAQLYVNGPFRDNGHSSEDHGFHEHRDREYSVTYNLIIHVPRATELTLHTVNGTVKDAETAGKFDVHSVNGAITMTNIAGSGTVNTVNGAAVISFRENPKADVSVKTINGKVDVTFQPGLSADLRVKTFHGEIYTDFDVTALAGTAVTSERRDGKFVYRSNDYRNVRVGAGGPQLSLETLNGGIQIHKGDSNANK